MFDREKLIETLGQQDRELLVLRERVRELEAESERRRALLERFYNSVYKPAHAEGETADEVGPDVRWEAIDEPKHRETT